MYLARSVSHLVIVEGLRHHHEHVSLLNGMLLKILVYTGCAIGLDLVHARTHIRTSPFKLHSVMAIICARGGGEAEHEAEV